LKEKFCTELSTSHIAHIDPVQFKRVFQHIESKGYNGQWFWKVALFGFCYGEGLNWKDIFSLRGIPGTQCRLYVQDRASEDARFDLKAVYRS